MHSALFAQLRRLLRNTFCRCGCGWMRLTNGTPGCSVQRAAYCDRAAAVAVVPPRLRLPLAVGRNCVDCSHGRRPFAHAAPSRPLAA
eukprot:364046-Chlamydomonas_euryale.AAC.4